jgi:hypothetical protein
LSAINNPSHQPGKAVLRPRVTLDRPMPMKRLEGYSVGSQDDNYTFQALFGWFSV